MSTSGSGFIGAGEFARFMKRGEDWESSGWNRGARKIKAVGAMRVRINTGVDLTLTKC